ncbi:AAA family ATPase [Schaedlerella arabinosiphila]|uniref:AAA family ATPase n=1 Tax=Schaedlerella arabinosiphila TaxID=2044587 RepID=A0A9X5C640_9FIRM|nr:AAA family ATPase [Schaedlerella arabinosiphila]KAI4443613.1 DNA replication and repair protein RecF [Schaedlerella arabinosiphila]NDO68462.1 AAA family ATPase [Schaedlerella arabinosiphila]
MKLEQVRIKNFKGIEECQIDFEEGFNLLIGDNGYGKTSILEAISVGLGGFIAGLLDVYSKHFTTDEIRVVMEHVGEGSFNRRYITPIEVFCRAEVEEEIFEWTRRKSSVKASRSTVEPRDICKKAEQMTNEKNHILPILTYQSAARMWMQRREAAENIFSKQFYRTVGYEGCLTEASNNKMLMNWIRHMEKMEWKRKEKIGEYYGVKETLRRFMQSMLEEEVLSFEYDDQSGELIFVTESDSLPVRTLSAGYQSLVWMVLDIVYRMALLNPDLLENISDTPGIVLIDELDMHLHPKWQWNMVSALKSTFPNVQFIAATHSPIIIASCKGENLIKIDASKQISYEKTPYGLDVNDILSFCQGSIPMARKVQELLMEFEGDIDEGNLDYAEMVADKIKKELGENHPKVTWAEETLELEKIPLEE